MKKLIQPKGLLIISLLSICRPCIENSLKGSSQIFNCQFSRVSETTDQLSSHSVLAQNTGGDMAHLSV